MKFFCALSALVLGAAALHGAQPNIVANGSLENWAEARTPLRGNEAATGEGRVPAGFRLLAEAGTGNQSAAVFSSDTVFVKDGQTSLRMQAQGQPESLSVTTREIAVLPNTTYLVQGWVRGQDIQLAKGGSILLWVHTGPKSDFWSNAAAERKFSRLNFSGKDFDWTQISYEVTTRAQDDLIRVAVQLRNGTGTLWVDDLTVVAVSNAAN